MTVKLADIEGAREILKGVINPTPTIFDEKLSAELHARIYLKAECLQRSGIEVMSLRTLGLTDVSMQPECPPAIVGVTRKGIRSMGITC